jgi:hypothetical protein
MIMACLAFTSPAIPANEPAVGPNQRQWGWSVSLGVMHWPDLGEVSSHPGGEFDQNGFGVEIAWYRRTLHWRDADVLLGVDFGIFTAESDIAATADDLVQRGLYLTPSVKIGLGEANRLWLEGGAGWYEVDIAELDCSASASICAEIDDPFNDGTVGGYLGLRLLLGQSAFVNLRVHHADFGNVIGVDSIQGGLKGPFYLLSLGAAF